MRNLENELKISNWESWILFLDLGFIQFLISTENKIKGGSMNKTFLILLLVTVSCATTKKEDTTSTSVPSPSKKIDVIVVPETPKLSEEQKFDEVGLCSWYGEQFHNKPTASGELFDRFKLTAAHRTLPFGTSVKVQNLDNQKETLVRINDRGPYNKARVIDVSERAAEILDFKEVGVARVGLTIVKEPNEQSIVSNTKDEVAPQPVRDDDAFSLDDDEEDEEEDDDEDLLSPPKKDQKKPIISPVPEKKTVPSKTTTPSKTVESKSEPKEKQEEKAGKPAGQPKGFTVQIGVFKEKRRAENFRDQVAANFKETIYIFNRAGTFVVQIGDYSTRAEAVALRDRLKAKGIFGFIPPK